LGDAASPSPSPAYRRSPSYQNKFSGRQFAGGNHHHHKQTPPRFARAKKLNFGYERIGGSGFKKFAAGWQAAGVAEQSYVNTEVVNDLVSGCFFPFDFERRSIPFFNLFLRYSSLQNYRKQTNLGQSQCLAMGAPIFYL
jgi:hypothetical protein